MQEAAYGTLLRGRRQRLHRRIVTSLEGNFPEVVLAQPALLAQHCSAAGLAEKAVGYWLKARPAGFGRLGDGRSGRSVTQGLEVLAGLPDSPERQQQELDLQTALAWALTATKGWAGAEVEEPLARARALAEQLPRPDYLAPLVAGQWTFHQDCEPRQAGAVVGRAARTNRRGSEQFFGSTAGSPVPGASRFLLWRVRFPPGRFWRSMGLADPEHRTYCRQSMPIDPYPALLSYLALTLLQLGYLEQARPRWKKRPSAPSSSITFIAALSTYSVSQFGSPG